MKRGVTGLVVALLVLTGTVAFAQGPRRSQEDGLSVLYPWVISSSTFETLIGVARPDAFAAIPVLPIHLNFYNNDCTKLDRHDELTVFDVDVYVAGSFALGGIAGGRGGHLDLHIESAGTTDAFFNAAPRQELIGEAVVAALSLGTWAGYSAVPNQHLTTGEAQNLRLAAPSFFGAIPGVVDPLLVLAIGPQSNPTAPAENRRTLDSPTGFPTSTQTTTVDVLIFNSKEVPHSSRVTYRCGLTLFLDELDPIALAQNLPIQTTPPILDYPHGWVHLLLTGPADGGAGRNWFTDGVLMQSLAFGTFKGMSITNLWHNVPGPQ